MLTFWRRQWHPTPVLLPRKSHGWRSLVGYSPWGCEELDTTERLYFPFSLSCIGGGNGNPLQCSCLKNPRDGGAWWAAIYGVTQSRTQLKWLSSSSVEINLAFFRACESPEPDILAILILSQFVRNYLKFVNKLFSSWSHLPCSRLRFTVAR